MFGTTVILTKVASAKIHHFQIGVCQAASDTTLMDATGGDAPAANTDKMQYDIEEFAIQSGTHKVFMNYGANGLQGALVTISGTTVTKVRPIH
jgi:hypothetical protein